MARCPAVGDSGAEVTVGKISSSTCVASSYICKRRCGGKGWERERRREGGRVGRQQGRGGREREGGREGWGERERERERTKSVREELQRT